MYDKVVASSVVVLVAAPGEKACGVRSALELIMSSSLSLRWRRRMKNHAPIIAKATRTMIGMMMPSKAPVLSPERLEVDGWR